MALGRNRSMLALMGAVVLDLARSAGVRGEHVEELEARLVDEAAGYDDAEVAAEPVAGLGMSRLIGSAHSGLPPAIIPQAPAEPFTPVVVEALPVAPAAPEPAPEAAALGEVSTPPAPEELAPAEPQAPAEPVPEDPAPTTRRRRAAA